MQPPPPEFEPSATELPPEQPATSSAITGLARFTRSLGPGLITGAADDDPSGIATYSQAGAAFGFGMAWTAVLSFPLMTAVQFACARLGLVSGRGLAAVLRVFYPRWLLWMACALVVFANVVNIAADLGAMAEVAELLTGVPSYWWHVPIAGVILAVLAIASYRSLVRTMKYLTLVLFSYVATAFIVVQDWTVVLQATFWPRISFDSTSVLMLVAIFGTTISPYLFFWQTAQAVEEERAAGRRTVGRRKGASKSELRAAWFDVLVGMGFSVLVMFFILVTTGATLHPAGIVQIETARQAAEALRPIAGSGAYVLFSLGILGTGFLGVPVLAGSAAYAVSEAGAWRASMNDSPRIAPRFFGVLATALVAGVAIDLAGVNAVRMLFIAAVVNGVIAAPLIVIVLRVTNDARIMNGQRNGKWLNAGVSLAALLMLTGAVVTVWSAIARGLAGK